MRQKREYRGEPEVLESFSLGTARSRPNQTPSVRRDVSELKGALALQVLQPAVVS
jgi:hypothetical protein